MSHDYNYYYKPSDSIELQPEWVDKIFIANNSSILKRVRLNFVAGTKITMRAWQFTVCSVDCANFRSRRAVTKRIGKMDSVA